MIRRRNKLNILPKNIILNLIEHPMFSERCLNVECQKMPLPSTKFETMELNLFDEIKLGNDEKKSTVKL